MLDHGAMRVAVDENVARIPRQQARGCGAAEFMTMTDVNGQAAGIGNDFIGEYTVEWVDVSIHRADRRDGAERVEHVAPADISSMKNP